MARLLFDHNLSPRLVRGLADLFPGSDHVFPLGLAEADDDVVWERAKAGGFAIASKDADFHQRAFLLGPPPKVVWVRVGNCSTRRIGELFRARAAEIEQFLAGDGSVFELR